MGDTESIPVTAAVVATEDHLATTIDGETVLLELESGTYYGFNEVGSHLWELVQEPRTVESLCETIHAAYDDVSAEQCRRDVRDILHEMIDAGLIEVEADNNPATQE
ncbi:hypothetical protein B2G88_12520 [Natronolimnobius baerhuensis]|uniref:PqqD family protein n=2 Tax=Natronolimnobius baerhuensis TaxID=253108 RepID=A0A202EAI4_9EURY|nr:hypothetical protein B2G88_12520 [Natronolimnobius baerhuensis]